MQTIYLDISNKGVTPTIYAKQGDVGRKFQVVLTDSGLPYSPASGSAFSAWYSGASGDGNYTEIGDKSAFSVNGNKVTVEMIAQMLSNDGDGVLSLVLNDPNGNQISTWNIPYICESVPGADSEAAKDYYTAFSKAVENLPYPDTSLSVAGKAADAAAVGAALSGKAPALDWSHIKWYVIGDSLTAQDNAFTNKRYYDFVQEKTGIQVIVDGIGGTGYGAGASDGESYYDRVQNIPDDVDIVTIFGSGNDIRFAESANMEIYNTLSWMALNKPGLRVIVVPPAPWLGYNKQEDPWKAYCDRLQACASVCNFRYVSDMYDCPPFNPNFTGHMEVFFTTDPEGIHPDENGHKALAPYFYNALLEELALDESVVVSPGGSGGSGGSGQNVTLTTAQINALDDMFKVCAFIKDDVSAEYNAFKTAFGITDSGGEDEPDEPEVTLTSISATYSGGDVAVGTAVSKLTGIVVTAHYSDGTSETVTGYTLSGEIAEGENTITVSYGGKTATFTVTGVAESGGIVNLFDKDTMVVENAFVQPNGTIYSNLANWAYAVIPVDSNTTYTLQKGIANSFESGKWGSLTFLNSNDDILQTLNSNSANQNPTHKFKEDYNGNDGGAVTFLTPEDCTSIRFTVTSAHGGDALNTTMLEIGDTCHDYVPYIGVR